MQNIQPNITRLRDNLQMIKSLQDAGGLKGDDKSVALVMIGLAVTALCFGLFLLNPFFAATIFIPFYFFSSARQSVSDEMVGFSAKDRQKLELAKVEFKTILADFASFTDVLKKISFKDEKTREVFLSFMAEYLGAQIKFLTQEYYPSAMGTRESGEKSLNIHINGNLQDIFRFFKTLRSGLGGIFKKSVEMPNSREAATYCTDIFNDYQISPIDMVACNFIAKDSIYEFLRKGYIFTAQDYDTVGDIMKKEGLSESFVAKLEAASVVFGGFKKEMLLTHLGEKEEDLKNVPIEAQVGDIGAAVSISQNISQSSDALPIKTVEQNVGSVLETKAPKNKADILKEDDKLNEHYCALIAKIEKVQLLPLTQEDKFELENIQNKVLPEILEIYSYSKNVLSNDKVKEFLLTSIIDMTASVEAVSTRVGESLITKADALSRYTRNKTMAMGGKN